MKQFKINREAFTLPTCSAPDHKARLNHHMDRVEHAVRTMRGPDSVLEDADYFYHVTMPVDYHHTLADLRDDGVACVFCAADTLFHAAPEDDADEAV